jgi:DNA-directed RNA polymerase I, II, and III subunit RPABC2
MNNNSDTEPNLKNSLSEVEAEGGAREEDAPDVDDEDEIEIDEGEEEEEEEEEDEDSGNDDEKNEEKDEEDDAGDGIKSKQPANNDDDCIYQFGEDGADNLEQTDEATENLAFEDVFSDEEETDINLHKYVAKEDRISKPILSKYEKVRLLGDRAKQLALGAKPMIRCDSMDVKEIALLELHEKRIPFRIRRPMTDGSIEIWDLSELQIIE